MKRFLFFCVGVGLIAWRWLRSDIFTGTDVVPTPLKPAEPGTLERWVAGAEAYAAGQKHWTPEEREQWMANYKAWAAQRGMLRWADYEADRRLMPEPKSDRYDLDVPEGPVSVSSWLKDQAGRGLIVGHGVSLRYQRDILERLDRGAYTTLHERQIIADRYGVDLALLQDQIATIGRQLRSMGLPAERRYNPAQRTELPRGVPSYKLEPPKED